MFRITGIPAQVYVLIVSASFMASVSPAAAQSLGGMGGSTTAASGIPNGVKEHDDLKDFHQVIAVQATSQQVRDFTELLKQTDSAKDLLSRLSESKAASQDFSSLDKAIADLCSGSRKFQAGFSAAQKDGLKRAAKSLEKTTAELELRSRRLSQVPQGTPPSEISTLAEALSEFSDQQLALGQEMSITLAGDKNETFNLPFVRSTAYIGGRSTTVNSSSLLSQAQAGGEPTRFRLSTTVDLSELQQRFAEILSAELDQSGRCERRVSLRQATILGASPASSAILRVHFERWLCHGMGQGSPTEIAEGDGTIEVRLTPVVEKSSSLGIATEIKRVQAVGMLQEELKSGDLGSDLREKVGAAVLAVSNAALDAKKTLPSALQTGSTLLSARFEELGAGGLNLIVEREIQLTKDQVTSLAAQLNQSRDASESSRQAAKAP